VSKPTQPVASNPWDPAAWQSCSAQKVSKDPDARRGSEVVRAPTEAEIRVLQKRVPEAAGKCLFVLEREPGAESPLSNLPTGSTLEELDVLLGNIGYVPSSMPSPERAGALGTERTLYENSILLYYSNGKYAAKSARSWKDVELWEALVDGTLTILTAWGTLEGGKEFGRIVRQCRWDPGFREEYLSPLTYLGDPATVPPLTLAAPSVTTLYGFYPRRMLTVGYDYELYAALVERFPRLRSACFWATGLNLDSRMTSLGFCLARALADPSLMNTLVDPAVFTQPPWSSVGDPSAVPAEAPLIALFAGGEEVPMHAAIRGSWQFKGEVLFESRVDYSINSAPEGERTTVAAAGIPIVSPLSALEGGAVGSVKAYYTLAP